MTDRSAFADLDAYLARIGYCGGRAPTLETLAAIQLAHLQTIAFENIDPLLRRPVRLDLRSLQDKLVHAGRGGYCFEHNLLLKHMLESLGFRVTGLAARVLWNVSDGEVTPRTHMLLHLMLEQTAWLVDVAFSLAPTAPLRIETDVEQHTPHGPYRLVDSPVGLVVEARLGDEWKSLYVFDLQPQHQRDYEMANWFVSTHPQSHFLHRLMVALALPGRRLTLRDNEFTERELDGAVTRQTLTDPDELARLLHRRFGIRLPDAPGVPELLTRIARGEA